LTASFTAPASDGGSAITNYEYSINGGTSFTAVSPASTLTSITITGLTNGTSYDVQVRALNAAGSGSATASVSGTPRTTPSVTTGASSSVAAYSVSLAGNITNTGGANATVRGFEYSTTSGFTTGTGTQVSASGDFGTGAFTNAVTNLASGSAYYYRAFASNSAGISYGAQSNFTTLTVPGGKNPSTANATTAFLGDMVTLNLDAWQTLNGTNRSYATVFGRYNNADLSLSANTVQGEGRAPGSSADGLWANTPRFSTNGTFYWAMRVSYGSGNDYWFDASRSDWSDLALERPSAATLNVEVSALNNPTSVTATNTGASQINLAWTRGVSGTAKDTLIVRSTDTNFTAPTQGTAYSAGNTLGGDAVVYRGSGTHGRAEPERVGFRNSGGHDGQLRRRLDRQPVHGIRRESLRQYERGRAGRIRSFHIFGQRVCFLGHPYEFLRHGGQHDDLRAPQIERHARSQFRQCDGVEHRREQPNRRGLRHHHHSDHVHDRGQLCGVA